MMNHTNNNNHIIYFDFLFVQNICFRSNKYPKKASIGIYKSNIRTSTKLKQAAKNRINNISKLKRVIM